MMATKLSGVKRDIEDVARISIPAPPPLLVACSSTSSNGSSVISSTSSNHSNIGGSSAITLSSSPPLSNALCINSTTVTLPSSSHSNAPIINTAEPALSLLPANNNNNASLQSATFKKLKTEMGAFLSLFNGGGNGAGNGSVAASHHNSISFRKLALLDGETCTHLVDVLKVHGYFKLNDLPPEFINACGNLYSSSKSFFGSDDEFKHSKFVEREMETGYRRSKDREAVYYRRGYHIDDPSLTRASLNMDPARDMHSRFEQYFFEAGKAAHVVLQAVIKGLGGTPETARAILPASHEHNVLSTNSVRAFFYPETPVHTVICPPHTDLGLLTLVPSNFPGLQVYSLCAGCGLGWESTHKSLDSTDLVVITGETLTEYSGGYLPAGLHRVVSEKPPPLSFIGFPSSSSSSSASSSLFVSPTTATAASSSSSALSSPLFANTTTSSTPSTPTTPSTPPTPTTPAAATTTTTTTATGKKSRSKKAQAAANGKKSEASSSSSSLSDDTSSSKPTGRISLPFLLRARGDAKLDGALIGLRTGMGGRAYAGEKTVSQFFEEERMRRCAQVGLY